MFPQRPNHPEWNGLLLQRSMPPSTRGSFGIHAGCKRPTPQRQSRAPTGPCNQSWLPEQSVIYCQLLLDAVGMRFPWRMYCFLCDPASTLCCKRSPFLTPHRIQNGEGSSSLPRLLLILMSPQLNKTICSFCLSRAHPPT